MKNKLYHYTRTPFKLDKQKQYDNGPAAYSHCIGKPNGLWVSVDDSWEEWCICEDFRPTNLTCKYEIIVSPVNNILYINSLKKLNVFHSQYNKSYGLIDWEIIVKKYDGIIMSKYFGVMRHKYSWYYSWDIASGCIWNLQTIKSKIKC